MSRQFNTGVGAPKHDLTSSDILSYCTSHITENKHTKFAKEHWKARADSSREKAARRNAGHNCKRKWYKKLHSWASNYSLQQARSRHGSHTCRARLRRSLFENGLALPQAMRFILPRTEASRLSVATTMPWPNRLGIERILTRLVAPSECDSFPRSHCMRPSAIMEAARGVLGAGMRILHGLEPSWRSLAP